jgi:LacI family transcriptional regulator
MPVRLIDVAERAGVSIATASRSLNGAPGVSPAVAERVREVAEGMGFVANSHARSLAGGQESSVGLVVGDIADPYFTEIAAGVVGVAAETRRLVQISHATDPAELLAQVRLLRANRVGAIIVAGSGRVDEHAEDAIAAELDAYRASGGRVAVIGRHSIAADAVLPDNVAAGTLVARHLIELGHTRVAVVAGPADLTTVADRLAGVTGGLAPIAVTHHAFSREGGVLGARAVLRHEPSAIVALSDVMALGVLAELRERGIRVPEDVAVVGFDDITLASELTPALTTVRIGMAEIGAAALRMTELEPSDVPRTTPIPAELVVRATTGPPE